MDSASPTSGWNAFARAQAAQRWKRQSAAMGRQMTEAIVAEAKVQPGMHVLDVASGTGEPAISIAQRLNGTGLVVGIDISAEPLKIAEQRARERGLSNTRFEQADVHSLPFANASFDRVTCRLGIMFFSDLPRALSEIRHVLKPGGRVTLLAWGPMEQPYFDSTIGTILRVLHGSSLPASAKGMFRFGEAGVLRAALSDTGFCSIEEELRIVPWSWPGTPEDVWEYFQEVTVPFKPLFEATPEGQRENVNAEVLKAIGRYYDGTQVNFTATICLVSASTRRNKS
ncbi:MAG TPA: class I SAM-dependent methyltransferase [Terriglobales bacterium]|nr:class I SAM-dependent methyltransferase [Terriglobales bacterium]